MSPKSKILVDMKTFSLVIPGSEDLEAGSGAIHRHNDSKDGLEKTYDPNVNTLYENFLHAYAIDPEANFVGWRPQIDGKPQPYVFYTYYESKQYIEAYSRALAKYDLLSVTQGYEMRTDGSPICTMGHFMKNSMPLLLSQFSVWRLNGTVVPLYDTLGIEAIAHACSETELKTILCNIASAALLLRSISEYSSHFSSLKNIIVAEGEITEELRQLSTQHSIVLYSFEKLLEEGKTMEETELQKTKGDDFCMICYTSGTTGMPKGALFSHQNMVCVGGVCRDYINEMSHFGRNDYYISYLPMAHAFEHFMQTAAIAAGMGIGFSSGDVRVIVDDFKELRPSLFASVPRLLDRIIGKVKDGVKGSGWMKRKMFEIAFERKKRLIMSHNTNRSPFWDGLVFSRLLKMVGLDNVRAMVTGSAPITADNLLFLRVLFLTNVLQGLGATETSGGACVSLPSDFNTFDHCGCPIKSMEAKLVSVPEMNYLITDTHHGQVIHSDGSIITQGLSCSGRGECCFRGYNIIKGYYRQDHINKLTFDTDGWYHSGDIAIWNEHGALQIVDRKKDIFKLSQGEYVSPDKVTGVYQSCNLLSSLFVYGDSYQSYLVAVVIPSEFHLQQCLKERGKEMEGMSFDELCRDATVKAVIFEEMNKVANASKLNGFEKIKNIFVDCETWTVENGMLTPTMKLKRNVSKNKYKDIIADLYKEGSISSSNQ